MIERIGRVVRESSVRGMLLRAGTRLCWQIGEAVTALGDRISLRRDMSALTPRRLRPLLSRNAEFKDRHLGERCFILGTGPSLRTQNLDLLAGEVVFATNLGHRFLAGRAARPTYYVIVDRILFEADYAAELHAIAQFVRANKSILFVESNGVTVADDVFEGVELRHLHSIMRARDYARARRPVPIDPTLALPGFESVVHGCVTLALYMGFAKIYLLGCDLDYFSYPRKHYLHAYADEPGGVQITSDLFREDQIELMRRAIWEFETLRELDRIAQSRQQAIFNATAGGHLDVLNRVEFETLFPAGRLS